MPKTKSFEDSTLLLNPILQLRMTTVPAPTMLIPAPRKLRPSSTTVSEEARLTVIQAPIPSILIAPATEPTARMVSDLAMATPELPKLPPSTTLIAPPAMVVA